MPAVTARTAHDIFRAIVTKKWKGVCACVCVWREDALWQRLLQEEVGRVSPAQLLVSWPKSISLFSFRREWIRVKGSNAQEYPTCLPWGAIHLWKWAGPEVLMGLDQARTASSWEDARRNQTQMYVSTYKLEVFRTGIFVWGYAEGDVCSPEDVCHLRLKLEIRNLLLGCSGGSLNHQWEPNIQAIS